MSVRAHLQAVWRYRGLVTSLISRNLKVRYQGSMLGFVWILLNPIVTAAILVTVFRYIIRIDMPDYWAFLLSGFFAWNFTGQTITIGSSVLFEHAPMRRAVAFPEEVPILASCLTQLIEFLVVLACLVVALALGHHGALPASFALLPLAILAIVAVALGTAFALATLSAFFADVVHIVPILLLMLFYLSPIFYPLSFIPQVLQPVVLVNPVAATLVLFQTILYDGIFPSAQFLVYVLALAFATGLLGYVIFNKHKPVFAEIM